MWFSGLPLLRLAIALRMFRDIASRKNSQTALTFPAEIPPACSLISSFGLKGSQQLWAERQALVFWAQLDYTFLWPRNAGRKERWK